jgi:hypothetical protein
LQEKAKAKIANVELTIKDSSYVTNDPEEKLKGLKEVVPVLSSFEFICL